ncbi:MAG: DNA translocase FtsK 4TM domain-containing protein, partial [Saprospiraceae bacterium]|nr:DNA translocase FtsK 4TM domain-containing protein [Saprospiraceae bacterium]
MAKTLPPKKGEPSHGKPAPKGKQHHPQPAPALSFWDKLSAERKLDVLGVGLALTGILMILGLVSPNRSDPITKFFFFISQIFGWGVYILPIGLLVFGVWLVIRKIERIPALAPERVTGSILLFVWLLTALHALVATNETAELIGGEGRGGGTLGGAFLRALWFLFGGGGTSIALLAWLIVGIAVLLDKPVKDLFFWLKPLTSWIRDLLNRPLRTATNPQLDSVSTENFTPIDSSVMTAVPPVGNTQSVQPTRTVSG